MIFILFTSLLINQIWAANQAIYGEDNRVDVYQSSNELLKELSYSTAAMIPHENLVTVADRVQIRGQLYKDMYRLCPEEKFRDQISAAYCSGTLIDKDIILTAGHCVSNSMDCPSNAWVFDFRAQSQIQKSVTVPSNSVYQCKRVIYYQVDLHSNIDFAIIKLDRPVTDRKAVNIRLGEKFNAKDKLALIGHPRGLPTKIAANGSLIENGEGFIKTNLDAFSINSGSGVFNQTTGELEGILVSGLNDFDEDKQRNCIKSKVYTDKEGAEVVTRVEAVWKYIDQL
jgi:V8-like Glu-specific endopeptidase